VSEVLRVERVSKSWATGTGAPVRAVRDASLAADAGETIVVTGPSGSGKTTLLSMLGGLLRPDEGRVSVDGLEVGGASEAARERLRLRTVGFVFQRGLLLADLTARQNVALVLRAAGRPRREARARADALLARLGIAARADCRPHALSAGECQRVALARALAMPPRLLLADEPTAHLDSTAAATVADELRRLARESGAALVVVTHDARLARIADRTLRLEDGQLTP
jgi:ABC-type lipoprotein export system ATPase subunit